jgi:hypothetical protein
MLAGMSTDPYLVAKWSKMNFVVGEKSDFEECDNLSFREKVLINTGSDTYYCSPWGNATYAHIDPLVTSVEKWKTNTPYDYCDTI